MIKARFFERMGKVKGCNGSCGSCPHTHCIDHVGGKHQVPINSDSSKDEFPPRPHSFTTSSGGEAPPLISPEVAKKLLV